MLTLIYRIRNRTGSFLRGGYPYLWLSLLVVALYVKTLAFRFTDLDDYLLILDNQYHLRSAADILPLFTSSVGKFFNQFYRPFLQLSFLVDALAGGKDPFAYHVSNVLFHAVASCMLFALLVRMRYGRLLAFMMTALFAVHPVLTQAVAWVPGRNDSLLTIFVLGSLLFLIRYGEAPSAGRYIFHLLFLVCSLMTKETAVMAIPIFALYLSLSERLPLSKYAALVAGWLGAGALWWVLRIKAIRGTGINEIQLSFLDSVKAFVQYIGKIFFPVHLTPYPVLDGAVLIYGVMAILMVAVALLLSEDKRKSRVLFGACWLVLFFVPSFIHQTVFYEHRAYLPMIGLIFIIAEMGGAVKRLGAAARYVPVFGFGFIGCFFVLTFLYSDTFINRAVFAGTAARLSPRCEGAFINLGNYYNDVGDYPKAIEAYRQARMIKPSMAIAYFNTGEVYRRLGNYTAAVREYERAIAVDPKFMDPRINLGGLYIDMNMFREAKAVLDAAAAIDKDSEGLRFNQNALAEKMLKSKGNRKK